MGWLYIYSCCKFLVVYVCQNYENLLTYVKYISKEKVRLLRRRVVMMQYCKMQIFQFVKCNEVQRFQSKILFKKEK